MEKFINMFQAGTKQEKLFKIYFKERVDKFKADTKSLGKDEVLMMTVE